MKPEGAQKEKVPAQDATVMPVGEPEEEMTSITRKETMACRETTEDRLELKELTSVDRKPEVAQQRDFSVEDAVVKPIKGWKKRRRGKKQAAGRCEEPKELT
jgi:hypothetical protein